MNTHTPIVVKMQLLVNYHKNKDERYWKFKGRDTIVVYNCEKVADAVSFANKIFGNNNQGSQRFPVSWSTLDKYLKETTDSLVFDEWYVDHLINTISCISPEPKDNSISSSYIRNVKGWKKTDFGGDSFYITDIEKTSIPRELNKALRIQEEKRIEEENVGDKYDGYHQEDMSDVDREEPCI